MSIMTAERFFAEYKHVVEHDFEVDGQPVPFFENHPRQWGTEDARIELPSASKAKAIALNDDGSLLAVGADDEVFVYETSTIILKNALKDGRLGGMVLEFKPGSNRILAIGSSLRKTRSMEHRVRLCDLEDGQNGIVHAVEEAAWAASKTIMERLSWTEEDIRSLNVERDIQALLFAAQNQIGVRNGQVFKGIKNSKSRAFSRDGSVMLYHAQDRHEVVVLDVETLKERFRLVGHTGIVVWTEMSPDDTLIATSSWDRTVRVWNASSGELIHTLTGATNQSWGGAFSPDGKLIAAGSGDRKVRVWSIESGELLHTLEGYTGWVRSMAFSPDGKSLAAGGDSLRIFDVASGDCIQKWQVDSRRGFIEIRNVQYTSKGLLVFQNGDGRTFLYDAKSGKKGQLEHGPDVEGKQGMGDVVASPDGETLYTVDFDGVVRVWKMP